MIREIFLNFAVCSVLATVYEWIVPPKTKETFRSVAAVFVNWYFTDSDQKIASDSDFVQNLGEAKLVNSTAEGVTDTVSEPVADVFSEIKLNRTKAHDEALDGLQSVLDGLPVDSDAAESVAQSVDVLSNNMKSEADIESLISAKVGISSVVVINGDNVNIVVEKGKLNEDTVVAITDIVTKNTLMTSDNITVSEAK